jgi:membrane protein implicated in regulation of membrane protease activity
VEGKLRVGEVYGAAVSALGSRGRRLVPLVFFLSLPITIVSRLVGVGVVGSVVDFIIDVVLFALLQAVAVWLLRDLREQRAESSIRELFVEASRSCRGWRRPAFSCSSPCSWAPCS